MCMRTFYNNLKLDNCLAFRKLKKKIKIKMKNLLIKSNY